MPTQQELTTSVVTDILSGNLAGAEKSIGTLLNIKAYENTQAQRETISSSVLNSEASE